MNGLSVNVATGKRKAGKGPATQAKRRALRAAIAKAANAR